MMMADVMEALGIARGDYVIRVNNRKVLDGVLEAIGLGGDENAGRRLTVLRAIDKLDKFGVEGVRLLLGPVARMSLVILLRVQGLNKSTLILLQICF
jgi:histidyl-tRNA synthetase